MAPLGAFSPDDSCDLHPVYVEVDILDYKTLSNNIVRSGALT